MYNNYLPVAKRKIAMLIKKSDFLEIVEINGDFVDIKFVNGSVARVDNFGRVDWSNMPSNLKPIHKQIYGSFLGWIITGLLMVGSISYSVAFIY